MFAEAAKVLKGKAYATSSVAFSGAMWASRPTARIDGGNKNSHIAPARGKRKAPLGKGSCRGEAVTGGMERKGNAYAPAFTFPSASADSP